MSKLLSTSDYLKLPELFYQYVSPEAAIEPKYNIFNKNLAKELNLDTDYLLSNEGLAILSGKETTHLTPIAQAYMGHQFGNLTMLGDGRAILLGELKNNLDLQLKGGGSTPFSRGGDGMATLGPMLREYIISEAMHALKIPTTRSLAVIETGKEVLRNRLEKGALVVRLASSHLRVGTFQYASYYGELEDLQKLADYAINKHYPHLKQMTSPYLSLFKTVIKKQAKLIADWQLVGFIHGVMNTDNMTISGETIDYGPCAFLDIYKSDQVFSSIDFYGRYAYNEQPQIGLWNLTRFAEAIIPLLHDDQDEAINLAKKELNTYIDLFEHFLQEGQLKKIGLTENTPENIQLINQLFTIMEDEKRDYTETFRALTLQDKNALNLNNSEKLQEWYNIWIELITPHLEESINIMKQANPAFIPRNYLVEEAISEVITTGKQTKLKDLLNKLENPYAYSEDQLAYIFPENKYDENYQTFCGT